MLHFYGFILFLFKMNEFKRDEPSTNILFVQTVQKYPCLYNYRLSEYSRRDLTEDAWMNVAQEMNLTVPYCKEKWKNLRCVFVRKLRPSPAGSSKKSSKPYYLSKFMSFILPYIKTNSVCDDMSGNVPNSPTQPEHEDVPSTTDFPELSKQQRKYAENEQTPPVKKQKIKLCEPDKSTECLQSRGMENTSTNENPRQMFLLSLLPEINDMTENQMRIFRRKVLQLIDEIGSVPSTSE